MYKILNKLFGWDYVAWSNSCDNGIARVYKSLDNKVWYFRYKNTKLIDLIKNQDQVVWLTCKPSKYIGDV